MAEHNGREPTFEAAEDYFRVVLNRGDSEG